MRQWRHNTWVATGRFLMALCCLATLASAATACINDRDTDSVALEARGLPDTVSVITGRFERNPPLYYEMRIRRVEAELRTNPNQPDFYDDISAAYDRLGKDDDALRWIEKKRQYLPAESPTNSAAMHEEWYRYYANSGTFLVHRWLRAGADGTHISPVKDARARIAHAIAIKPNAHFGREKYQLLVMNWLIQGGTSSTPSDSMGEPLGRYIVRSTCGNPKERLSWLVDSAVKTHHSEAATAEAATGLSGLIVLGNAWESPDVSGALADCLNGLGRVRFGYLASLRCRELLRGGKPSILLKDQPPDTAWKSLILRTMREVANKNNLETRYKLLRDEAERWQADRTAYMETRLRAGRHPDTDPTFWNDYHPAPPPSLDGPWLADASENFIAYQLHHEGLLPFLGFSFVAVLIFAINKIVRKISRP